MATTSKHQQWKTQDSFDPDWLLLREPVDARARDSDLMQRAADWAMSGARARFSARTGSGTVRIVDLGAGTGSAARALSPLIPHDQEWTLVERDPNLAAFGEKMMADWSIAGRSGQESRPKSVTFSYLQVDLMGGGGLRQDALVEPAAEHAALVSHLSGLIRQADLVSASALFDLCSAAWISAFVQACAQQRVAAWLTLIVDGRKRRRVSDRLHPILDQAFHADMHRDKGFGPALGRSAGGYTIAEFQRAGFEVHSALSDWQLNASDARLYELYEQGYADAASTQRPDLAPKFAQWLQRQQHQIGRGHAAMMLGHVDIFALPA